MNKEKEIQGLIRVIRALGWICIIVGAMALLAFLTTPISQLNLLKMITTLILTLCGGILLLFVSSGLSKKRKWAWILGVLWFSYSAIHNFILGIFGSKLSLIVGGLIIIFLIILLREKKYFLI